MSPAPSMRRCGLMLPATRTAAGSWLFNCRDMAADWQLETMSRLGEHPEPGRRALAADVLSQFGAGAGQRAVDGPFSR